MHSPFAENQSEFHHYFNRISLSHALLRLPAIWTNDSKVGTECIPLEDCYRPVRGGGFPIQYVIDFPGITFPDVLGSEYDFRFWAFVLDFVFYMGLVQLVY